MTSIWTFSDIHQECPENAWDPQEHAPASADVVVVAGDVNIPLTASVLWLNERMAGSRVVFVPGNHEFWRGKDDRYSYQDQVAAARDIANGFGIDLLVEGESTVIGDTRFVGGTGWTDFAVRPPWVNMSGAMSEARRRMNDYSRIRYGGNRSKDRLDPRDTLYLHRKTSTRIAAVLYEEFAGPTVVVTHHAPHPQSLGSPVEMFDVPQAYASSMGAIIERTKPNLWLHGHLHGQADYVVGETRILMNARGHACEPSCKGFQPGLVVEVERMECALEARM
jgi:Icc-related predicted phosphoesterase